MVFVLYSGGKKSIVYLLTMLVLLHTTNAFRAAIPVRLRPRWLFSSSSAAQSTNSAVCNKIMTEEEWKREAQAHSSALDNLLYPSLSAKSRFQPKNSGSIRKVETKIRTHLVSDNPIYNFLHSYYKYSTVDLKKYSPGMSVQLLDATPGANLNVLNEKYMTFNEAGGCYNASTFHLMAEGKYGLARLTKDRDLLRATSARAPFFGCFGMHEWAMLYSGNGTSIVGHQESTPLRVDQKTIDALVGGPGQIRCTHYDAFRFFQPAAKPMNMINTLSRENAPRHEQPGCIHANMDLFRYAYQLYPFVSSALLVDALRLALEARKVDMRASPYDVSAFEGCEVPICVETPQGRKLYIEEQERIASTAVPIRKAILSVYEELINS